MISADNDNNQYRFYVYAWCYPDGTPFYVGKGCGNRDIRSKTHNTFFKRIVEKIKRFGEEPHVVRWQSGLSEESAHSIECAYIRLFGRRNNKTGILANLTDGGEGTSGMVIGVETRMQQSASHKRRLEDHAERQRKSELLKQAYADDPTLHERKREAMRRRYADDPATRERQSIANRKAKRRIDNTSGFRGVSFSLEFGKWRANIKINGKRFNRYFPGTEDGRLNAARHLDKIEYDLVGDGNFAPRMPTGSK